MNWLAARLKEPSTWAGLGAVLPAAITLLTGPVTPQLITAVVGGLAAVFVPEVGVAKR